MTPIMAAIPMPKGLNIDAKTGHFLLMHQFCTKNATTPIIACPLRKGCIIKVSKAYFMILVQPRKMQMQVFLLSRL